MPNRIAPFAALAFASVFIISVMRCKEASSQDPQTQVAAFDIPPTDDGLPGAGPIRRYPWFQDLWQQKRSAWAGRIKADSGSVVFLGDSITQGWGDDMLGSFDGMPVANRGISGDTTRGMLLRLKDDVLVLNPICVVLLMGTNDLEEGAEPETIASNIQLIVDAIHAHDADVPLVLCNVFPSTAEKARPSTKIKQINALLAEAFRDDAQVTIVDTWTLFASESGDAKTEEFPDLLHPNEAGYRKWASALRPIFATLGLIETEAEKIVLEPDYESLFNGRDLTGWCLRPTSDSQKAAAANWKKSDPSAPDWPIVEKLLDLTGKPTSPDGRYRAINGRLVVTTPSEGRRIQQLWTTQEFPTDFTLKLEFRATPNADSGVFLREPQLQCRDYALAGPYKDLKNYRPQDWNDLTVVVRGTSAHCTCNGEVIEADFKLPANGPIGLEGDRGQIEYRNIRIKAE